MAEYPTCIEFGMAMVDYALYVLACSYWVMDDGVNLDTTCSNFMLL
jgi:hypothetical protein